MIFKTVSACGTYVQDKFPATFGLHSATKAMFYSHTVEDSKFNLFTSFLSAVAEGKQEYVSYVNGVIREAHSFLLGEKTLHDLDKDTFSIVVYLSENDSEFLKNLEVDSIKREDYMHVREVLKQDNVLVY